MVYCVKENKNGSSIFEFEEITEINIKKARRLLRLFPTYKIFNSFGNENGIEQLESLIQKEEIIYNNNVEIIKEETPIIKKKYETKVTTKPKVIVRGNDKTLKKGDMVVTLSENIIRRKPYLDSGSILVKEFGNVNTNILKLTKANSMCKSKKGIVFPILDIYNDDISTWVKCGTKGWMCYRYKDEEYCAKYK